MWSILVAQVASGQKDVQKSDKAQGEDDEASEVGESSGSEDVASHIVDPVPLWIGVMEVVIGLYVIQGEIRAPGRRVRRERKLEESVDQKANEDDHEKSTLSEIDGPVEEYGEEF